MNVVNKITIVNKMFFKIHIINFIINRLNGKVSMYLCSYLLLHDKVSLDVAA